MNKRIGTTRAHRWHTLCSGGADASHSWQTKLRPPPPTIRRSGRNEDPRSQRSHAMHLRRSSASEESISAFLRLIDMAYTLMHSRHSRLRPPRKRTSKPKNEPFSSLRHVRQVTGASSRMKPSEPGTKCDGLIFFLSRSVAHEHFVHVVFRPSFVRVSRPNADANSHFSHFPHRFKSLSSGQPCRLSRMVFTLASRYRIPYDTDTCQARPFFGKHIPYTRQHESRVSRTHCTQTFCTHVQTSLNKLSRWTVVTRRSTGS